LSSDSKHVEALRRGPRLWNQWRAQNPTLTPNLTGIALTVAERQMGPISGGPVNFAFARLRHASLRFATLTGANLEMADLSDADLSDARLDGANLSGADLSEALLDRADFARAKFGGVNLSARACWRRAISQDQIDEALGDALVILPPSHPARRLGGLVLTRHRRSSREKRDCFFERTRRADQGRHGVLAGRRAAAPGRLAASHTRPHMTARARLERGR
jgi:sugar/nucleoside kinase (ribokinase family)